MFKSTRFSLIHFLNETLNSKQIVYEILTTEDMRSFYASVSCIKRGLDPRYTKLAVVGDVNRSGSIVLAATPPLKALGVKKTARHYIDVFLGVKLKLIILPKVILIFLKSRKMFRAKLIEKLKLFEDF